MTPVLDGLITFFSWHHAVRAEKVLVQDGYAVELIPGPREISPNCGTALRFRCDREDGARRVLKRERVQIEATHRYLPPFEAEPEKVAVNRQTTPFLIRWIRRCS